MGPWVDISGTLNGSAYTTQTTFTYTYTPASAGTTYYRAVLSSACATGFATLTTNSNPVKVIVHDATSDPFCTAPQCDIVYVDPTILNEIGATGTPVKPYKYISTAATTGVTYIRVAKGSGTDGNIVNIPAGCVIEGGYVRSGGSGERWEKSSNSADITSITFSGSEPVSGVRHIVAFKSDGKSNWTVKDLDITTANTPASTYDGSNRGMSNYGFLIINNSQNYTLSRLNITVGNAGAGANGTTPAGTGGANNGGAGGNGGAGSTSGNTPSSGTVGTVGGNSGGSVGAAGTGTGSSSASCTLCACGCNRQGGGGNGGNGGNALAAATNYTAGDRPSVPTPTNAAYYNPAGQSASGSSGRGGGGGGGGQGARAGRLSCGICGGDAAANIKGGNGGTGGHGGLAGTGGYGGGGAFGIWRYNSNTGANVEQVKIALGNVGNGGDGAAGQTANNSNRGPGAKGDGNVCVGNACNATPGSGGTGGTGSDGGRGRDGANGTSAQIITDGGSSSVTATIPFLSTISLDNFSQRSNISGKMCRYSEIDMTKTSGTWVLPTGLTTVKDLTSSTTSYTPLTVNSIKVTTDNAGTFFDISNGTVLNKFLYTATDNRTLPAVSVTPATKVICKGSTIALAASNSYDVGNIQQYDYVVFADGSNANAPYSGGSYNSTNANYTTPAFTTVGKYWVRYRERHNCCGWSRPVFESFDVIDVPNAPTAISITGGPYCFDGTGKTFTINVTGTKAYTAYDSWELFDNDPSFGTPTPLQTSTSNNPSFTVTPTQTTTYYVRGKNQCGVSTTLNVTATIFADPINSGVIASTSSFKTCNVSGSAWHYFRNASNEIIAAINSNGFDLGSVTMTVTIETSTHDGGYYSPSHGNGGIGNARVCLGLPELSMKRWYQITVQNQPPVPTPSTIRLFFTPTEYTQYKSEISTWKSKPLDYDFCYGHTNSAIDLSVSKNETNDIPLLSSSASGGPSGAAEYEMNVPSFSTFRFHTSGGKGMPLPVELVSFTGWNQGSVNKLQWVTASELHSDKYEIEKSTVSGVWNTIGDVRAAGNSNIKLTYNFTDNNPVVGDNYYRLKMIDIDGTFKYSNTINIPISEAITNGFVGVYPNPTGGELNVDIQSVGLYDTYVSVYDVLGKTIFEKPVTIVRGMNKLQFNFNQLAKGTYILRFADAQGTLHSTKFVKD